MNIDACMKIIKLYHEWLNNIVNFASFVQEKFHCAVLRSLRPQAECFASEPSQADKHKATLRGSLAFVAAVAVQLLYQSVVLVSDSALVKRRKKTRNKTTTRGPCRSVSSNFS